MYVGLTSLLTRKTHYHPYNYDSAKSRTLPYHIVSFDFASLTKLSRFMHAYNNFAT